MSTITTPPLSGSFYTAGELPVVSDLSKTPTQSEKMVVTSPRPRRRRMRQPAKDSLWDIMHEHAGTSLFVRPIMWTDLHSQILGATFEELPPSIKPKPEIVPGSPPSKGHMRPSQAVSTLSGALTDILTPASSQTSRPISTSLSIRTITQTMWPDKLDRPRMMGLWDVYFGKRVYNDQVRVPMFWNFPQEPTPSSSASFHTISTRPSGSVDEGLSESFSPPTYDKSGLPMLTFIGRAQLACMRNNFWRPATGPKGIDNSPVRRLQQLRSKPFIPSNADRDAFLVGVFLAMAQQHFYKKSNCIRSVRSKFTGIQSNPERRPNFQEVTLRILTHDIETSDFIVYTACVTAGFLERFDEPSKTPRHLAEDGVPGMHIEHARVPIWPILGLKERLGHALGEDVVGAVDLDNMEKWEEPEEEEVTQELPTKVGEKRKREVFSEVFNSSVEEDSDSDSAVDAKKPCLAQGPRIGMVN